MYGANCTMHIVNFSIYMIWCLYVLYKLLYIYICVCVYPVDIEGLPGFIFRRVHNKCHLVLFNIVHLFQSSRSVPGIFGIVISIFLFRSKIDTRTMVKTSDYLYLN